MSTDSPRIALVEVSVALAISVTLIVRGTYTGMLL